MMLPRLDFAAGQRHCLRCPDEAQRERWLDRLCAQLQQQQQRVALLSLHGALIGNLSARDNILLAARWHDQRTETEQLQRLQSALQQLGYDNAPAWLNERPAQLSGEQLRASVLARALLSEPQIVLCDEDWFSEQNRAELALLERAAQLLQDRCWLLLHVDAAAVSGQPWHGHIWQTQDLPAWPTA